MLKKIVFISFSLLVFSCGRNKPKDGYAEMSFEEIKYDFGKINEGQVVEKKFFFTNTSSNDLQIEDVSASCGCTVAEYPKGKVKPNEKAMIKVSFNSRGKHGKQEKNIKIIVNTKDKTEVLKISADVKPTSGISGF
ncbi:DUF1573 domain-containing protein [Flavobacterium sp.]|uniref:DUF1573 domain-containing protein n=1 Tax=Flavobacterium sp. TaxID=239 RepID=UPI003751011B